MHKASSSATDAYQPLDTSTGLHSVLQRDETVHAIELGQLGKRNAPICVPGTGACFKAAKASWWFNTCPDGFRKANEWVNGAGQHFGENCLAECNDTERQSCFSERCKETQGRCSRNPGDSGICLEELLFCRAPLAMDESVCNDRSAGIRYSPPNTPSVFRVCPGCVTFSEGKCTLHLDKVQDPVSRCKGLGGAKAKICEITQKRQGWWNGH